MKASLDNLREKVVKNSTIKEEIIFKGIKYKVGLGAYNRSKLNGNFFKTFTFRNGDIYAYNKIDHLVYRTY